MAEGGSRHRQGVRSSRHWGLAIGIAGLLAVGGWGPGGVQARTAEPSTPAVQLSSLPPQARDTYRLIHEGGPFPYRKDGTTFFNRERLLPSKARGYYREYTVPTPGSRDRGPRRIVCGGPQPTRPEACYYTGDHYASFARIAQ
jgi:ribonuclease T1